MKWAPFRWASAALLLVPLATLLVFTLQPPPPITHFGDGGLLGGPPSSEDVPRFNLNMSHFGGGGTADLLAQAVVLSEEMQRSGRRLRAQLAREEKKLAAGALQKLDMGALAGVNQGEQRGVVPIVYVATELSPLLVACVRTTRMYDPTVPIIVVASLGLQAPMKELTEVLQLPHVQLKLLEDYVGEGSGSHAFSQKYIHHSVNGVMYEQFCFQRFFVLRDVAIQEGFARVFHVDHDLVIFDNHRVFVEPWDVDFIGLDLISTHFSVWKLPVLERFCDYMLDFYARPVVQVDAGIHRFGYAMNATFYTFSDMFILKAFFIESQEAGRPVTYHLLLRDEHGVLKEGATPYLAIEQLDRITGWRCRYRDWEAAVEWRALSKESNLPVPYVNGTYLKGIQFQGNMCKKIALQVLSRVLAES